jgi:hypothetical protein
MVLSCILAVGIMKGTTKAANVQMTLFAKSLPRFYQLHPFRCRVYALNNNLQQSGNWKIGKLKSNSKVLGGRQTQKCFTQYGLMN